MTNKNFRVAPGERFHILRALSLPVGGGPHLAGEVVARGRTVTLTTDFIDATRDRNGNTFLDLVDNPDAQEARWGAVHLGPGPFPEDEHAWVRGDPLWIASRAAAQASAWARQDERERAAALRAVLTTFGPSEPTSVQTGSFDGGLPGDRS